MLHSRHVAAAAAVAASMPAVSLRQVTVANPAVPTMPPSPFFEGSAVPDTGGELLPSPYATPTERLICSVCGIVTTSEAHLAEHMAGRRHQKNLERLQLQGRAQAPADRASSTSEASEEDLKAKHSAASDGPDTKRPPLGPSGALPLVSMSTIDRLPSTLSDIFIRRSSSFRRHSSGNVYEGFPCVRVGDMVLPSSMDLRAFLEEMQTLELLDANTPEPMPTIKEKGGRQGGGGSGSSGGGGGAGRSREGPQGGSRSRPPSGRFTQGAALRAGLHADVGHPMAIPPPPHGHYAPRPQQPLGRSPQRGPVRQRFASFGGCGPGSSPGGGTALGYAPGMYAAPAPGMVGHGYAPVGMGYVPFMQPDVAQQQQQQAYIQAYQAGMHPGMMVAGLPQAPVGAHQGYYGAGHALQQQHDHRTPPRN